MFASGIVAEIGVNAYAVWHGIKFYADFNTGEAFPGMRTLGAKIGLSKDSVNRAIEKLIEARMVRVVKGHTKRRGQTYIARERMSVTIGATNLCTIVIDYVPENLRGKIKRLGEALESGKNDPEAFAEVEIIPGDGFVWDEGSKTLRGRLKASEVPSRNHDSEEHHRKLGEAVLSRLRLSKP
jgi:predicted transcriptional regulator